MFRRKHRPVAALHGGPLDGHHQRCPMVGGFLPTSFEPRGHPEGRYEINHADGSFCGGIYAWTVRS